MRITFTSVTGGGGWSSDLKTLIWLKRICGSLGSRGPFHQEYTWVWGMLFANAKILKWRRISIGSR